MAFGIIPAGLAEVYAGRSDCKAIDLRDTKAYDIGHMPGAVSIPYETFMRTFGTLPKNKMYILYCARGGTSIFAAQEMAAKGYEVMSVAGGFLACGQHRKRLY